MRDKYSKGNRNINWCPNKDLQHVHVRIATVSIATPLQTKTLHLHTYVVRIRFILIAIGMLAYAGQLVRIQLMP